MQVNALPTHTVSSSGTVTQRIYYNKFRLACVGISSDKLPISRFISNHKEVFLDMAKNTRKEKKKRTFKVSADYDGTPFIRFGGKYLSRELGLNGGDRLEVTRQDDCIILRIFSADELAQYEETQKLRQAKSMLRKLFSKPPKFQDSSMMMVAESSPNSYTIQNEVNHDEIVERIHKFELEKWNK
jgi:bifunctional DNA-binding transcriptional regulator/antitoxin component of YhaV-PrlF toxin-antitoxin module